jgi:hypothetical protein
VWNLIEKLIEVEDAILHDEQGSPDPGGSEE